MQTTRHERESILSTSGGSVVALPNVVYIMGTGRSGTTILEVVLTNSPGIAGLGEVTHLFKDGLVRHNACSCQSAIEDCVMWGPLVNSLSWTDKNACDLDRLFRRVERHSRFFFTWFSMQSQATMLWYKNENCGMFSNSARIAGADTIIDSSKYAGRALGLHEAMPSHVKIIWLVRSPEGLLAAFSKRNDDEQKPKSAFAAMLYYIYVMTCSWLVKYRLGDDVLVVSYEDLMVNPVDTLSRIERWCGLDLSESKRRIAGNEVLTVHHILTGNRLRKQSDLRFRPGGSASELKGLPMRMSLMVMRLLSTLFRIPKLMRDEPARRGKA